MTDSSHVPPDVFQAPGRLTLFGFDPTPAKASIRPRSRKWRVGGAVRAQAIGLVLAPVVGLVPPHAPWALGAAGVGFLMARRRWRHRFTVEGLEGTCPRCGTEIDGGRGMLREPHPVPCDQCHHEAGLELDPGVLEAHLTEVE